jgi:RecA-family ATPase
VTESYAVPSFTIPKTRAQRVQEIARDRLEHLLASREAEKQLVELTALEDFNLGNPVCYTDFLTTEYETPAYRVQDLWPANGTVMWSAYRKTGKSTGVQNIIYSLSTGAPFLSCPVVPILPDETIIHINLEVSERTQQHYASYFGALDNVYLYNLRGQARKFNILSDGVRDKIAGRLSDYNAAVLIVDPLGPLLRAFGLDENKNSADGGGAIVEALNNLAEEAGIQETLLVHHTGHGSQWRARGSSVFGDAPDVLWNYRLGRHKLEEADGEEAESIDPNARYFSATGRLDKDWEEKRVFFDERTHRLSLAPAIV